MTIVLSLLLVPYAIVVAVFLVLGLMNVYHLIHYGATTRTSFIFTALFIVGSMLTFLATWWVLQDIDWAHQVNIRLFSGSVPQL